MRGAAAIACVGLAIAAALPCTAKARAAQEPDLSGTYAIIEGKLPNGSTYDGKLAIEPKTRMGGRHGTILWRVTWTISSTEEPVRGIGVYLNGAFFVAYGPEDDYGLTVFMPVKRGGRGEWMLPDDTLWGAWFNPKGTSGLEGLRGDLDAWNGDYRLHGHTNVDGDIGSPYSGNLSATKAGDVVHLRWSGRYTKGKDKPFDYPGIGIDVPGFLAAQWSNSGKGGVGVYSIEGATMKGFFAEDDGMGSESLAIPNDVAAKIAPFLP